ncbi:hypothetical protein BJ546DRAFT_1058624 [Cryomyces antarcticus]
MHSPGPFRFPPTPSLPLFPLSPERVNGTRPPYSGPQPTTPTKAFYIPSPSPSRTHYEDPFAFTNFPTPTQSFSPSKSLQSPVRGYGLPQSPSLPEIHELKRQGHARTSSDVQGMVARFECLEVKDHAELRKRDEAALKKAVLGREEAESDVQRLKEELRKLKEEKKEGDERERKVSKRLEIVMEELHIAKSTQDSTSHLYEKQLRATRKESLKASSQLIKVQEEFKATRNALRATQSRLDLETQKSSQREQEAFTAQYQIVGVQEELEKTRQAIQVVEEERDALKTRLGKEEVARIAAEGRIALPRSKEDDNGGFFTSPGKSPAKRKGASPLSDDKENAAIPKGAAELRALGEALTSEKRRREEAEEKIHFMRMECQFQCCSCRIAERQGSTFVHDDSIFEEMEKVKTIAMHILTPPMSEQSDEEMDPPPDQRPAAPTAIVGFAVRASTPETTELAAIEQLDSRLSFSPTSGTFRSVPSPIKTFVIEHCASNQQREAEEKNVWNEPSPSTNAPSNTAHPSEREEEAPQTTISIPYANNPSTSGLLTSEEAEAHDAQTIPLHASPTTPTAPQHATPYHHHHPIRTITTTTTIPIQFTPLRHPSTPAAAHATPATPSALDASAVLTQAGFDREAALAAIRHRRGRARSIANGSVTPRRGMVDGVGMGASVGRRDVSAPTMGAAASGGRELGRGREEGGRTPVRAGGVGVGAGTRSVSRGRVGRGVL